LKAHLKFIFRDALFYGVTGTASKFASILIVPVVVRAFSEEDYGLIDALRIMSLVSSGLCLFALEQAAARHVAVEEDLGRKKLLVWRAFFTSVLATMFFMVFMVAYADVLARWFLGVSSAEIVTSIYLIALAVPGAVCNAFSLMLLRWHFRRFEYALCAIGGTLLLLSTTLIFVIKLKLGILGVFIAQLVSSLFPVFIFFGFCRKYFHAEARWPGFEMAKFSFPLAIVTQLANIQPLIERFLIVRLVGLEGLGNFSVAQAAARIGRFPADSLYMAWFPYYSKMFRDSSIKSVARYLIVVYFLLSGTLVCLSLFFSGDVIRIFAGSGYETAAQLLPVLLSGVLIEVGASIVGVNVFLAGKTRRMAALYVLQIIVFVTVTKALAGGSGLVGISYAFLVSRVVYYVGFYVQSLAVRRSQIVNNH
jgi:O-antigen/teichoic acid export membrane protein